MTTVTIGEGSKSPLAGAHIAVGHGIIEFPMMVATLYGFERLYGNPSVKAVVSALGGLFLIWLALDMLRGVRRVETVSRSATRSPTIAGILLSAGNPYFLIWWATVGATLVLRSAQFGWLGFLLFAVVHWLCDLLWSTFLSVLSYRGGQFFGKWFQKVAFALCGAFLLAYSGRLLLDAARLLLT